MLIIVASPLAYIRLYLSYPADGSPYADEWVAYIVLKSVGEERIGGG